MCKVRFFSRHESYSAVLPKLNRKRPYGLSASTGGRSPYANLAEVVDVFLFYLCRNHPFIDGKKLGGAGHVPCLSLAQWNRTAGSRAGMGGAHVGDRGMHHRPRRSHPAAARTFAPARLGRDSSSSSQPDRRARTQCRSARRTGLSGSWCCGIVASVNDNPTSYDFETRRTL